MTFPSRFLAPGPHLAEHIRHGDPYEVSNGELIQCVPAGKRGSRANLVGGAVLETDPLAPAADVDLGYSNAPNQLRAPDIAVGDIPDQSGWAQGAPPLAVEYADTGQDEQELQRKIKELLAAGTKHVWVVRLTGPRRVEVHQPGAPMRVATPGMTLTAPTLLQNPVRVEELYDPAAAHEAVLRNLLQRKGYASLDAVIEEGLRTAVRDLCDVLGIPIDEAREAALANMRAPELDALRARLKAARAWT